MRLKLTLPSPLTIEGLINGNNKGGSFPLLFKESNILFPKLLSDNVLNVTEINLLIDSIIDSKGETLSISPFIVPIAVMSEAICVIKPYYNFCFITPGSAELTPKDSQAMQVRVFHKGKNFNPVNIAPNLEIGQLVTLNFIQSNAVVASEPLTPVKE